MAINLTKDRVGREKVHSRVEKES